MSYPGASVPGVAEVCLSKVELRVECKNLQNRDVMSKSDPCAVLHMARGTGGMMEIGRTENVKNCLDPKFSKSFVVDYHFEEVQKIKIAVYDIDNATPSLSDDDNLGYIECTLGELVSSSVYTRPLMLKQGQKAGNSTITVRAEEVKEGGEVAQIFFKAMKLENKDFMGKSDPYLEILRPSPDGNWQVVYRSEVVKNNLNPSWRPVSQSVHSLCGGNLKQQIKLDVYDWDSNGAHDIIGSCTTTMEDIMKAASQEVSLTLINTAKQAKKKSYKNSGILIITSCKIVKEHTFLEFVFGGMQINLTMGIDFTGSNGNPSQPSSLHYISQHQPNEYMQAIRAVGQVCQDYDTDKMFPVLGFGAQVPPTNQVSHEFAVNFNPQNPYCAGIEGVLQAYMHCIRSVTLYGPTNASPIINHVARFAATAQQEESVKGSHAYFILLMLTDGALSDMGDTKTAIVRASALPMSLIIVGVGGADFTAMNELDGDNGVLRAPNGEPVKRDIVQFVPFRNFKQSHPAELARHVLAEVPKQVVDYFKMRGIPPRPKQQAPPQPSGIQPGALPAQPGATPQPGVPPTHPGVPQQLQGGPAQPGAPQQWQGGPAQPGSAPQPGVPPTHPGVPQQWQGGPAQPGAPQQWQGGPAQPGAPQQWQGGPAQPGSAPQPGVPPTHPGVPQQWQGGPAQPGAPQQWQGGPAQPGAPQQWQGGPAQPGAPQQWQGGPAQPGAPQQWQGGPAQPGAPQQWQGGPAQPGAPQQWQGYPPQPGAPQQWQGGPPQPGAPQQWQGQPGAPPPWQGAPGTQAGAPASWQGAPHQPGAPPSQPGAPSK